MNEQTTQKRFSQFSCGAERFKHKIRVGRPSTLERVQLEKEIKQNPHQTLPKLAHTFGVSGETIPSHLHNLEMTWKISKWVHHVLS